MGNILAGIELKNPSYNLHIYTYVCSCGHRITFRRAQFWYSLSFTLQEVAHSASREPRKHMNRLKPTSTSIWEHQPHLSMPRVCLFFKKQFQWRGLIRPERSAMVFNDERLAVACIMWDFSSAQKLIKSILHLKLAPFLNFFIAENLVPLGWDRNPQHLHWYCHPTLLVKG